MATPSPGLLLLDGGLSALGGLKELYLVLFPLAVTGLAAVVLCVVALVRRGASRRFAAVAIGVSALNGAASIDWAVGVRDEAGYEGPVLWFAVQAAIVLALGAAVALVRLRRDASAR